MSDRTHTITISPLSLLRVAVVKFELSKATESVVVTPFMFIQDLFFYIGKQLFCSRSQKSFGIDFSSCFYSFWLVCQLKIQNGSTKSFYFLQLCFIFHLSQRIIMQVQSEGESISNERGLPAHNLHLHSRFANLLRHKAARNYLRYEFEYSDCEKEYFNGTKTFDKLLLQAFPNLKTRNLTMVEWRKIRSLITNRKCRRFSPKFIQDNRIDLERFRAEYKFIEENVFGGIPISAMTIEELLKTEFQRLIIHTKRVLNAKRAAVAKCRKINDVKSETFSLDTSSDSMNVFSELIQLNETIDVNLEKLFHFYPVKVASLLSFVSQESKSPQLSPECFRLHCHVCVYETINGRNKEEFQNVIVLIETLLQMCSIIIEIDLLAIDVIQFLENSADNYLTQFQKLLTKQNIDYVEVVCLPAMHQSLRKISSHLNATRSAFA